MEQEVGKRIALNKMDWDSISAVDILALFNSLCKGDKVVTKVEIYPSLFGLQKMNEEKVNGPPKEIFDLNEEEQRRLKAKQKKKKEDSDSSSDDDKLKMAGFDEEDQDHAAFNQAKLREYEI